MPIAGATTSLLIAVVKNARSSPWCLLKICGNLALEEALHATLLYLRDHLPIDVLFAEYFDPDLGAARTIARADMSGGRKLDMIAMVNALQHRDLMRLKDRLADDNQYLYRELQRIAGDEIVDADFGLKSVMRMVRQAAPTESPILLTGETGVGKDVIANAIHLGSPRREGPFVPVNCGAIPATLIDSELSGHEKGAFTGALAMKRGRFERAHKGTILLDEIGEMPLEVQVRLLRVLQHREVERVGGTERIPVDIRIIAATNKDMSKMVSKGRFREDLWFRLNVFPIAVPPLRERRSDIPALVQHFIDRKAS